MIRQTQAIHGAKTIELDERKTDKAKWFDLKFGCDEEPETIITVFGLQLSDLRKALGHYDD